MQKGKNQKVLSGFMAFTMTSSVFTSIPALADSELITVSEDASVSLISSERAVNFGKDNFLMLQSGLNTIEGMQEEANNVAYLKFSIGNIDPSKVQDIALRLRVLENEKNAGVNVYEADSDWNEEEINWENQPGLGEFVSDSSEVAENEIVVSGLKDIIVKALENGKTEITLAICVNDDTIIKLESREADNAPALQMVAIENEPVQEEATDETFQIGIEDIAFQVNLLTASEEEINKAEVVKQKIEALYAKLSVQPGMTIENYVDYWAEMTDVRKSHTDLTPSERGLVGNETYRKLVSFENKYKNLENEDISIVVAAVDGVHEELLNENDYLKEGTNYLAALAAYNNFVAKQRKLDKYTEQKGSDYADEVIGRLSDTNDKLTRYTSVVKGFMKKTIDSFNKMIDAEKDKEYFMITALKNGTALNEDYVTDGNTYITRFVEEGDYDKFRNDIEEYILPIKKAYEDIKNSGFYKSFLDDETMKNNIKIYLMQYYMYETDKLKVLYGNPGEPDSYTDLQKNLIDDDLWFDGAQYLCTYLKGINDKAGLALTEYADELGGSIDDLIAYKDYNDTLYEAMNIVIGNEVEKLKAAIGKLSTTGIFNAEGMELKDLRFTREDIDLVVAAVNTNANFCMSIQEYLYQEEKNIYTSLFGEDLEHPLITEAVEKMTGLANDEIGKYDSYLTAISEYNLTYKSGYHAAFGEGEKSPEDPDLFIKQIKDNTAADIKYDLLKYYKDTFIIPDDDLPVDYKNKELTGAIEYYEEKLKAIKELRTAAKNVTDTYDEFQKYFGYDFMMSQKAHYNNFTKHEDVCNFVDDVIATYNATHTDTIILDDVMGAFDDLVAAHSEYNIEEGKYEAKYSTDNYARLPELNRAQPYVSEEEGTEIKNLSDILYKHNNDVGNFITSIDNAYSTVIGFKAIKESLYSAKNNFSPVTAGKTEYAVLEDEYNTFDADKKYCIPRETENKMGVIGVTYENWDKAINVMNLIDAIDATTEIEEFKAAVDEAATAYDAIKNTGAGELVADAAYEKLEFYKTFKTLYDRIVAVPVIVSQYQIKEYDEVISKIREDFDEAALTEHITLSGLVDDANRMLKDREFEMSCAKEARRIDNSIIELDDLKNAAVNAPDDESYETAIVAYLNAFADVEAEIYSLVQPRPGETRPANMTFGMLLQYSKFMHHREDIDELWVNTFVHYVDAIGTITYTSDFDEKDAAIANADAIYEQLTDNQKSDSRAVSAKTTLELRRSELERYRQAADDAQAYISEMRDISNEMEEIYAIELKPEKEARLSDMLGYFDEDAGEYVPGMIEIFNDKLSDIKPDEQHSSDICAYNYLVALNHVDDYDMACAKFVDLFQYYAVQNKINELWAAAQEAHRTGTLLDSTEVKFCEDEYKALANFESPYDTARNQQELVENTSKLAWVRMQIDKDANEYIAQFKKYMDMDMGKDMNNAKLISLDTNPDTLAIKYSPYIAYAYNLYYAMSDNTKKLLPEGYEEQIVALNDALIKLNELYALRGGKAGDIDEDGKVTIKDIVMIVDYALDNNINPADNKQFLRADIVHPEVNTDPSRIDVNDVIAAIDLIEF